MARLDYGYVRSWDDPRYLQQLQQQGYAGALFQMNDPRLPQLVQQARQMGLQYGIWGAPNQVAQGQPELNPQQFAQVMADTAKRYGTTTAALDLEFPYKGYQGSQGWNNNQALANYWKQYAPGFNTIITPMGSQWAGQGNNQQDFNFGAWKGIASGWNPQAYGAMLSDHQDPALVARALVNAGIDPSMIAPVLAPGQQYGGGAIYGLNEFGDTLPKVGPQAIQAPGSGGPAAPTNSTIRTTQGSPLGNQVHQMAQRLSQSQQQVQQGGLKWYGQTFNSAGQFARALAQHGGNYNVWAANHPYAAAGLAARRTTGGR